MAVTRLGGAFVQGEAWIGGDDRVSSPSQSSLATIFVRSDR